MRTSLWILITVLGVALAVPAAAQEKAQAKKKGYVNIPGDVGSLKESPSPKAKNIATVYYGQRLRFGEKKEGTDKKPWFNGEDPFVKTTAGWLPRAYISPKPLAPRSKGTFTGQMKVQRGQKEITVSNNATAAVKGLGKRERGHVERTITDPDQQKMALDVFAQLKTSIDGRPARGKAKAVPGRFPTVQARKNKAKKFQAAPAATKGGAKGGKGGAKGGKGGSKGGSK